jgi:hypothetical protein
MTRTGQAILLSTIATTLWAATVPAGAAQFVSKPTAARVGETTEIAFDASAATDVEVAVVGSDGKVVRHLAAGLLGPDAPAPFQKGALAQKVTWDGKDDLGCYCETSRFDIDPFDRLFVPDPLTLFSVLVLDRAGNRIARFGAFGNMDCRGPGSPVPEPEIALGWPTQVDCALGRVYIADLVNRRIVSVRIEHAAEAECGL